jgi:hypothetical protein
MRASGRVHGGGVEQTGHFSFRTLNQRAFNLAEMETAGSISDPQ